MGRQVAWWVCSSFALVPALAGAMDLDGEIRLQPDRIARGYSPHGGALPWGLCGEFSDGLQDDAEPSLRREATLDLFPPAVPAPPAAGPPVPTDLDLQLDLSRLPRGLGFDEAVEFNVSESLLNGLKRLKSKLLVDVGTYDASDPNKRWEGIEEVAVRAEGELGEDEEEKEALVSAAGGQLQGGLTLGVGTGAASASFGDVLAGTASALDLNPFHDVSAQFDFLIRTSKTDAHKGFDAFVIRVRGAFLGAFNGINEGASSDAATESELSISFGFAW